MVLSGLIYWYSEAGEISSFVKQVILFSIMVQARYIVFHTEGLR